MNPPVTLEKPKTPVIQFHEIEKLRAELRKQSKNKERLAEFEVTINEAIKEWDKKWVIEFTNEEWNSLITNEKLPPIEEVKSLLRRKITERKEITTETQTEQKWFLAEMKEKGTQKLQSAAEKWKELITGTKAEIEEKIKKNADKIKKFWKFAAIGAAALSVGLSLKIWGYKILKFLSFGFYNPEEAISKLEKEKFILEHPEEAAKKYGQEVVDAVKKGTGEKDGEKKWEEKWSEWMLENAKWPLKILAGIIGLGTATGVMGKLLSGKAGASILKLNPWIQAARWITSIGLGTMKFVGRLGVLGLVGYGAYRLYEHFEKNPSDLAQAGENPDKSWWSKMIDKVWWNDPKNAKTEREKKYLLSFVSGEKKIEETTEDEHPEGMESMGNKMEKVVDETSEPLVDMVEKIRQFPALASMLAITIGSKIGMRNILGFTRMNASIAINLAKVAFWWMPLTAIFGLIGYLWVRKIASESVPKDPKEFEDFIVEHAEDIDKYCEEEWLKWPDGKSIVKESQLRHIASYIAMPEKINASILAVLGKATDAATFIGKKVIGESPEAVEKEKNLLGLHTMARNIQKESEENNDKEYKKVWKKLDEIIDKVAHINFDKKTLTTEAISKTDIEELKKSCEWTNILIESHHGYILWSHAEKNEGSTTYLSIPQRICIDPEITDPKKRHDLAKEFQIDTQNTTFNYLGSLVDGVWDDVQWIAFALTEAIAGEKNDDAESLIGICIERWWNVVCLWGKVFLDGGKQALIELPTNTIRLIAGLFWAKDIGITMQEYGAQYANGFIGMCIFSKVASWLSPATHYEWKLAQLVSKIPGGKLINFTARSAIKPITAGFEMWKLGYYFLTDRARLVNWTILRTRFLGSQLSRVLPDSLVVNAKELSRGIQARYLLDDLDKILKTWVGMDQYYDKLGHYLEECLWGHKLHIDWEYMEAKDIVKKIKSNKNLIDEVRKSLDNHLESLKIKFTINSPKMKLIAKAMKKIPWATLDKIEKVVNKLAANPAWWETLSTVANVSMFAYMAYDIWTSDNARETITKYGAGMAIFYSGLGVGKVGMKMIGKWHIGTAVGVLTGLAACLIPGPVDWLAGSIQKKADTMIAAGEFNTAVWNEWAEAYSMANWFIANRALLGSKLWLKVFEQLAKKSGTDFILRQGAKRLWIELLAKKVSQKIAGTMIEKFIVKLGQKIGWLVAKRGASAGGASLVPVAGWVVGAGLAIWTAKDVYDISAMVVKARNMKDKHESQSKKAIKDVIIDRRGEESISDMVKINEWKDYKTMTESEKDDAKMKYFEQVARCNITIEREDGSIETYGYAAGNPTYAKIQEKDGTVTELTKEDLNQAETWELPNNYKTEKIPYKDLPPDQLMFYYGIQIQKLKIATGWQQLDATVESDKKVTISREQFSHDTISIERQSDNSWQLVSNKKKVTLSGKYDFHGALALAGLALYSMEFLSKEIKEKGDKAWKSEDGTLTPFYSDKDSIIYALDDEMDTNFIEKWLPFYENNLKLRPSQMVQVLNGYFWVVGKDLNLIGD